MRAHRVVLVAMILVLAACGSSSKSGSGGGSGTTTAGTKPLSTALGQGVTANEIKIGVALTDFDAIKQYSTGLRYNQDKNYQAFIDDINKKGGINGRKIVPVYRTFNPIPDAQRLAQICTQFTEDDKVFAVIGNVFDQTGDAQACIAKRHKVPLMVFELTQPVIARAPQGLIVYPGTVPERTDSILGKLLGDAHTLDGKKVGVLGETSSKSSVTNGVLPTLKKLNADMGTVAILSVAGTDTTTAQAQLDSFIERWKGEGVNAIWVTGTQVASKQFIEKLKAQMPDVQLITDIGEVAGYGRDEKTDGKKPNPYQGIISAGGPSDKEYNASENWKRCADTYKAQTGKTAPDASTVIPLPDGHTDDTYRSINDACQMLGLFAQIATKAGPNLNVDTWANAVNTFGPIVDPGGGQYASLHQGKYDIEDTFRLEEFDENASKQGDWKPLTALENAAP